MSVTSIFNEISYNATIRNSNNNNIDPNSITMTSVLMGDVNQDGVVNAEDISALNKYLLSPISFPLSEKGLLAANVKYDSIINIEDVNKITDYIMGVVDYL